MNPLPHVTAANRAAKRPTLPLDFGSGYEANYSAVMAGHAREVYASNYTLLQQLSRAQMEGVLEVSFRTRTGTVTLPVAPKLGYQLIQQGIEAFGETMDKLERDISEYSERSEKEEMDDVEGTSNRAQVFAFCLPMRPFSDAEFEALPAEARRVFDEMRAERANGRQRGGEAA